MRISGVLPCVASYDFVPETVRWNAAVLLDQVRGDVLRGPLAPGNVDEQFMWSDWTDPPCQAG